MMALKEKQVYNFIQKQDYIIDDLMDHNNISVNDFFLEKQYENQNFCTSKYGMLMFRRVKFIN